MNNDTPITLTFVVRDEELFDVLGIKQLISFAKYQAQYLTDHVDSKLEQEIEDVDSAKKILNARGFSVEEKLVY